MFVDVAIFAKNFFHDQIKNKHNYRINFYKDKYSQYVGIHCRRGDYVNNLDTKELRPTEVEYIKSGINKFNNRKFIIFSDDIDWCKKHFLDYKDVEYSCAQSPIEDFLGLMGCKDYILSGSSFSWWAAFINANKETKVVIPNSVLHYPYMSVVDNEKIGWNYEII